MGGVSLEILARLLIAYGLPITLQLGQVHVKGRAAVREVCLQGDDAQRRLRAPVSLLHDRLTYALVTNLLALDSTI